MTLGRALAPRARVRNFGSLPIVVDLRFVIADSMMQTVYDTTETGIELAPGESLSRAFTRTWLAAPAGPYVARAWTVLDGDGNPANDTARSSFRVGGASAGPWTSLRPMPDRPSSQKSKDGAWVVPDLARGWACAAKGSKTSDFYVYDLARDTWLTRSPIPQGVENKRPSKGAAGCSDGYGTVYATKGNNTQGFYRYSVAGDTWRQLASVPLGTTNKRLKGGTDLVSASNGLVYLLKGYKNEFWCYNPTADTWLVLPDAPGTVKWDKGSWLAHDNDRTIFAHKAKNHEFFAFDIVEGRWSAQLTGMPVESRIGSNKKSKDGGCATWFDVAVYALKGGNTQEFWKYTPSSDSWVEIDTMPLFGTAGKKKKVKAGADITTVYNQMYALKGNKTNEFWQYTPEMTTMAVPARTRTSSQAAAGAVCRARFDVSPNPARSQAVLRFGAGSPEPPAAVLRVFNVAGRLVYHASLVVRHCAVSLDLSSLRPGVYLAQVQAADRTDEVKLVVE
ncbi:T9SS type A sorting domain-containing protein [candidate division WOR-3 bacterium]|nr:T9SS type A sorting domain-containing protein [candidate division WOR-3 bacterium]